MDWAPRPNAPHYMNSRFPDLYTNRYNMPFNDIFLVFDNPTFVEQFRERALYVLDNDFQTDRLLALHSEFVMTYLPLLPEMYNRFPIRGTVEQSMINFNNHGVRLATFLMNRDYHCRNQLDALLERVSKPNSITN